MCAPITSSMIASSYFRPELQALAVSASHLVQVSTAGVEEAHQYMLQQTRQLVAEAKRRGGIKAEVSYRMQQGALQPTLVEYSICRNSSLYETCLTCLQPAVNASKTDDFLINACCIRKTNETAAVHCCNMWYDTAADFPTPTSAVTLPLLLPFPTSPPLWRPDFSHDLPVRHTSSSAFMSLSNEHQSVHFPAYAELSIWKGNSSEPCLFSAPKFVIESSDASIPTFMSRHTLPMLQC